MSQSVQYFIVQEEHWVPVWRSARLFIYTVILLRFLDGCMRAALQLLQILCLFGEALLHLLTSLYFLFRLSTRRSCLSPWCPLSSQWRTSTWQVGTGFLWTPASDFWECGLYCWRTVTLVLRPHQQSVPNHGQMREGCNRGCTGRGGAIHLLKQSPVVQQKPVGVPSPVTPLPCRAVYKPSTAHDISP